VWLAQRNSGTRAPFSTVGLKPALTKGQSLSKGMVQASYVVTVALCVATIGVNLGFYANLFRLLSSAVMGHQAWLGVNAPTQRVRSASVGAEDLSPELGVIVQAVWYFYDTYAGVFDEIPGLDFGANGLTVGYAAQAKVPL